MPVEASRQVVERAIKWLKEITPVQAASDYASQCLKLQIR